MRCTFAQMLALVASPAYITPHAFLQASSAPAAEYGRGVTTDSTVDTTQKRPAFPVIGRPAPSLKAGRWLNMANQPPVKFGDGHIYVLDFTATWCGSCPETYPIMSDLRTQYGSRGVRVIYVTALWGLGEDHISRLDAVQEFSLLPDYFARHKVTEPVAVYDTARVLSRDYADDSRETKLPKLVVIDGKGIVREVMTGWEAPKARKAIFQVVEKLVAGVKDHP